VTANPTESRANAATLRRVAVILGPEGGTGGFLELLLPLLARQPNIEIQGVFIEEADARFAAELPFVQELCRVTFSVRELTCDGFEKTLALRLRSAQRALEILARRAGVSHSFQNVRGSIVRLLRETANSADMTVFAPVRVHGALGSRPRSPNVLAAIDRVDQAEEVLSAALHLAGGRLERVAVVCLAESATERAELKQIAFRSLAGRSRNIRTGRRGDTGLLRAAMRDSGAGILVLPASADWVETDSLRQLRSNLDHPICLVRRWQLGD
jgi:hypothetical protein